MNAFIFLLHVLPNVIGLVLNGLLAFIAFFHSPHPIRKYAVLILNFAICDFFACLSSLMVGQRIIPAGRSLFYVSEGICSFFSARTCYVSYSVMLHFYAHTLYSILLSFIYRYYILIQQAPSRTTLTVIILLIYVPSFIQMVLFSFADDPPEVVEPLIRKKFPHYNLTGLTISGNVDVFEWKTLGTILHMTLPITPVYICILILRRGIIQHLLDAIMSTKTKNMHQQLLTALTWQACLPAFYLVAVLSYACGQLSIYNHPMLEHCTFISVGFIPAFSPIFSLYFVRPYRDYVRSRICGQSSIEEPLCRSKEYSKDFSVIQDSGGQGTTV